MDDVTLTVPFDTVTLTEALTNLCTLTGAKHRVNSDGTVDLDDNFGEATDTSFTEGDNLLKGEATFS
jgi:hypothetical protein